MFKFHKDLLVLVWVWVWGFFLWLAFHRFWVFRSCGEGKSWDFHLGFIFLVSFSLWGWHIGGEVCLWVGFEFRVCWVTCPPSYFRVGLGDCGVWFGLHVCWVTCPFWGGLLKVFFYFSVWVLGWLWVGKWRFTGCIK